ncbi:hypothetical protein HDK64DRAFT_60103 [Phyllosticta capitalensis]
MHDLLLILCTGIAHLLNRTGHLVNLPLQLRILLLQCTQRSLTRIVGRRVVVNGENGGRLDLVEGYHLEFESGRVRCWRVVSGGWNCWCCEAEVCAARAALAGCLFDNVIITSPSPPCPSPYKYQRC